MGNFQFRRGTATQWASTNPVLLSGEMGVETDTGMFKIGNGSSAWNSLPYSSGPPGSVAQSIWPGDQGDDGQPGFGMPTGIPARAQLATDAKNWAFLGTATGATVTVGPVIWTGQYRQFMINYFISGYNGGTPVGRFLCGAGTPSTTAANNGSNLIDWVSGAAAPTSVTAASIPGMPLASVIGAAGDLRDGWIFIDGASGSLKRLSAYGTNLGTVAAPPKIFMAGGVFSDLGTNLLLQQAQLTVYDTIAATAVSTQTFTAGTYLSVWGRNND
jgi:hypothetical protein